MSTTPRVRELIVAAYLANGLDFALDLLRRAEALATSAGRTCVRKSDVLDALQSEEAAA